MWLLGSTDAVAPVALGDDVPAGAVARYPTPIFEINFTDDPLARYRDVVMGAFPVGYWRLGEASGTTAADESGYGRHGTYVGAPTLGQTSNLGDGDTAVSFNGTDEYVQIGSYGDVFANRLTGAYSIAAWVAPSATRVSTSNSAAGIVGYSSGTHVPFLLAYGRHDANGITDNRFWAGFYVSSTGWDVIKDVRPYDDLGDWTHLVVTWFQAPDTLVLYRDGQEVARRTPVNNVAAGDSGANMYIGQDTALGSATQLFPGLIDDVAIFDYELSPVQVAKMYAAGPVRSEASKEAAYDDLTNLLRSGAVRRGRSNSVDRVEAGSLTVIIDNLDGTLGPEPIVNLIDNPSAEKTSYTSALHVPDGWESTGATSLVSAPSGSATEGRRRFVLTSDAVASTYAYPSDGSGGMRNDMVAGQTYTWSATVEVPTAGGAAFGDARIDFVDVTPSGTTVTSSGTPAALDTPLRLTVTRTIPTGATEAYVRVHLNPNSNAGRYIYFDAVQLEEAASVSAYCDGDQDGCRWEGEPHESASLRGTGYVNVLPGRLARLRARYGWETYPIIEGTIDRLRFLYPGTVDSVVEITISDAFKVLSQQNFASFRRPMETPADRVRAALRAAAIVEDKINVDDSFMVSAKLQAITGSAEEGSVDTTSPLNHIRNVEQSERGTFLIGRDGTAIYQGVEYRLGIQPSLTLSDDGEADSGLYADLPITLDDGNLVNDRRITSGAVNSSTVRQVAPASIRRHFPHSNEITQLWVSELSIWSGDAAVVQPRIDAIPLRPARDPALMWPALLGLDVSGKVIVERHPSTVDVLGGLIQNVEGITHDITAGNWTMDLAVSPAFSGSPYVQRPSDWNTPITRPRVLGSAKRTSAGQTTDTVSVAFQAGALYAIQVRTIGTGTPTTTAASSINGAWAAATTSAVDAVSRLTTFIVIASTTVTETVTFTHSGNTTLFEYVALEIAEGFTAAGITANVSGVNALSVTADIGTLDSTKSIVLASVWRDGNSAITFTSDFVETYDAAAPSSFAAAYGPPGDDTVIYTHGVNGGNLAQMVEIKATADLVIG